MTDLHTVPVKVTFSLGPAGPTIDPVAIDLPASGLQVPSGTTLVDFHLVVVDTQVGGAGAPPMPPSGGPAFSGIQFERQPAPGQGRLRVVSQQPAALQLEDLNTNTGGRPETYPFTLFVSYGGRTYPAEASLVNQPQAS
jgi:hypothetical protein